MPLCYRRAGIDSQGSKCPGKQVLSPLQQNFQQVDPRQRMSNLQPWLIRVIAYSLRRAIKVSFRLPQIGIENHENLHAQTQGYID